MDLKQFFECNLFSSKTELETPEFIITQNELFFQTKTSGASEEGLKAFKVEYRGSFKMRKDPSLLKTTFVAIPSRNHIELIDYTLSNLISKGAGDHCEIILIDDRSTEDYRPLIEKHGIVSYLRVENHRGFNFSMLCNIAAKIVSQLGGNEIILWNNDLWLESVEFLVAVLRKHRADRAKISGTKLLYPERPVQLESGDIIPEHQHRGKVQFGGSQWLRNPGSALTLTPSHFKRFACRTNPLVNCDKGETFVTGAFQVIDLKWFLTVGGLNPSLAKNFQDTDLCLRANASGDKVMYYGKDVFFWHNESISLNSAETPKIDELFLSDMAIFGMIWNDRIQSVVC
jgi:GT2 family glycosyltransferase